MSNKRLLFFFIDNIWPWYILLTSLSTLPVTGRLCGWYASWWSKQYSLEFILESATFQIRAVGELMSYLACRYNHSNIYLPAPEHFSLYTPVYNDSGRYVLTRGRTCCLLVRCLLMSLGGFSWVGAGAGLLGCTGLRVCLQPSAWLSKPFPIKFNKAWSMQVRKVSQHNWPPGNRVNKWNEMFTMFHPVQFRHV